MNEWAPRSEQPETTKQYRTHAHNRSLSHNSLAVKCRELLFFTTMLAPMIGLPDYPAIACTAGQFECLRACYGQNKDGDDEWTIN